MYEESHLMKRHYWKIGEDKRKLGQTNFDYTHTTVCGYIREFVTMNFDMVTCKKCLKKLGIKSKDLLKIDIFENDNMKFRKKSVEIDAIKYTETNEHECLEFCKSAKLNKETKQIIIPTLEGDMICSLNDWIIKGVKGEFCSYKPDIFELTYEPVTIKTRR